MLNFLEPGIRGLVKEFVESGCPCPSEQLIQDRRDGYLNSTCLAGKSSEMYKEYESNADGIKVKVYQPIACDNLPISIYFHGGCFVSGGFETHQQQLRELAKLSNTLVICIQYRLAPEHTYPSAHDDVYQAVQYIRKHGKLFGGDSAKIAFVGDSAGAQLALVTTLRLKENSDWLPYKQVLLYPMLDAFGYSRSYRENGKHFIITDRALLSGFELYIGESGVDKKHPEISPILRDDFSGLPTTYIVTAEYDALRDEGELLYKKLLAQDVEVYCERYLGVIHGFMQLSAISNSAIRCLEKVASQLGDNPICK